MTFQHRVAIGFLLVLGFVTRPAFAVEPPADQAGEDLSSAIEEALSLRDPFKRPESAGGIVAAAVSELERYPVEQYKLVGVITGADRLRAIIQDPSGKTHFVSERMKIGTRRGVIREIRADSVIVREKMVNVLGKEEPSDSEIRLPDETAPKTGSSG